MLRFALKHSWVADKVCKIVEALTDIVPLASHNGNPYNAKVTFNRNKFMKTYTYIYEPVKLADLTRKSLHQVRQVQIWVYKACIYIMDVRKLKLTFCRFPFPFRGLFDHVVCSTQLSCYKPWKVFFQLINRSHPCEIRHFCLYLCLTPCKYLPLCCRHVVTGTFGMLLPSFSGSFTSWSCHHCIAHLIDAVVSCTTTCIPR